MAPNHWTHERKHFYKYMTAETAKKVLSNNTLRWSSPTLFNDPFDVQFDLHNAYDRDRVSDLALRAIVDRYAGRASFVQVDLLGQFLALLRDKAPGLSDDELREQFRPAIYEGMDRAERRLPRTHEDARAVIADVKLLCLSEIHDNILMWAHYSNNHTGIVLELSCLEKFDSAWGAAKPIRYMADMPVLFDEEKLVRLMSGDGGRTGLDLFENSVFVKAADWAYEREWRLIGGRDNSKTTEDIPFYTEEATGIYMGCRISEHDRSEIFDIVAKKYPQSAVYIGTKSERRFALEFSKTN